MLCLFTKLSTERKHTMIKTRMLKRKNKTVAVLMDVREYKRLKEIEMDRADYATALEIKNSNTVWIDNKSLKAEIEAM